MGRRATDAIKSCLAPLLSPFHSLPSDPRPKATRMRKSARIPIVVQSFPPLINPRSDRARERLPSHGFLHWTSVFQSTSVSPPCCVQPPQIIAHCRGECTLVQLRARRRPLAKNARRRLIGNQSASACQKKMKRGGRRGARHRCPLQSRGYVVIPLDYVVIAHNSQITDCARILANSDGGTFLERNVIVADRAKSREKHPAE